MTTVIASFDVADWDHWRAGYANAVAATAEPRSTVRTILAATSSGSATRRWSRRGRRSRCGKPSVSTKPGSTVWTLIPRPRSAGPIVRENASCACFDAVYGPDGPAAIVPATETTLTTSEGAPASRAGRNARRHQTEPR